MENKPAVDAQTLLDKIDNSRKASLVAAAKDPLWIWPAAGLLAALLMASFESKSAILWVGATASYSFGIFGIVGYAAYRRGTQPSLSGWTPRLKRVFTAYLLGSTLTVGVAVVIGIVISFYVSALLTFIAFSLGGIWYHLSWRIAVNAMAAA